MICCRIFQGGDGEKQDPKLPWHNDVRHGTARVKPLDKTWLLPQKRKLSSKVEIAITYERLVG